MVELRDKVLVITGGSAEVGRAAAEASGREGAKVAFLARGRKRVDNLREPVPGDHGAHGRFDDRAKNQGVQVWAVEHIGWYRGVAAVAVITLAAAVGGALATLC
jgi:NADP-dependent 3-hydroxy acid dehydrogenase YdfG